MIFFQDFAGIQHQDDGFVHKNIYENASPRQQRRDAQETDKSDTLKHVSYKSLHDTAIDDLCAQEKQRQFSCLNMIASENITSYQVRAVQSSYTSHKYAEGYPHKRYYGGCRYVDVIEDLAATRAQELFGAKHANVQSHSGTQANLAVFYGLLKPGDTILGMSLTSGGHLTHGAPVTLSGRWLNAVHYEVDPATYLIDYDQIRHLALTHRPSLIIGGFSAYTRHIDWQRLRSIADEVQAYLLADVAHVAGLVAAGLYPSPVPHAHVVTSTTHKTLRGPRGGIILTNDDELSVRINRAVFAGTQGGPMMHTIAAKAVCFYEALHPSFKDYMARVLANARALAESLMAQGLSVLTNGTDNHMVLVDTYKSCNKTGKESAEALEDIGIVVNKNTLPFDSLSPSVGSGIRLGTPFLTTQGLNVAEMHHIGQIIVRCLKDVDADVLRKEVQELCGLLKEPA